MRGQFICIFETMSRTSRARCSSHGMYYLAPGCPRTVSVSTLPDCDSRSLSHVQSGRYLLRYTRSNTSCLKGRCAACRRRRRPRTESSRSVAWRRALFVGSLIDLRTSTAVKEPRGARVYLSSPRTHDGLPATCLNLRLLYACAVRLRPSSFVNLRPFENRARHHPRCCLCCCYCRRWLTGPSRYLVKPGGRPGD